MKKTNKKGFTIVELVIVIAVIAILAAVLVPNISRLVKKANESSDLSLVRNLNTALAVENKTYATAYEAFEAVKEAGYDLTKIEAKASDNKILFDSENQCFVYLNNKLEYYPNSQKTALTSDEYYKLWAIVTDKAEAEKSTYSVYWNGAAEDITVKGVGFDAGEKTVKSVTYTGASDAHTVTIRTNSFDTVLTVKAELDTVKHYGKAKEVNVVEVAGASYHEFGMVLGNINLAHGHVKLENDSSVSNIIVKSIDGVSPTQENIKVTVVKNSTINMVISEDPSVEVTVEGEKATEVPSVVFDATSDASNKAYIGSKGYANYFLAFKEAKDGDTITLMTDVTHYLYEYADNITLDLNGHTFTLSGRFSFSNKHIKIKNGNLIYNGANGVYDNKGELTRSAIIVDRNATLTLDGVTFTSGSYGISALDNASYIVINNSTIQASGQAISTNNAESKNTKIVITSSTIKSTQYTYNGSQYDNTVAVLVNNSGSVEISESLIEGGAQGLIVRSGNATVKNSEIKARLGSGCAEDKYQTGAWKTGNDLMHGALIVGDWNKASYNTNASCTLSNTKITTDNTSWNRALIVLSQDGSCKTTLNYDDACGITEFYVHDITTDGITKGVIEVNGEVKRVAGN